MVSSIGTVCELPAVTRFFNGNPSLGLVAGGMEQFAGRAGQKAVERHRRDRGPQLDDVVAAIDEVVTTPRSTSGPLAAEEPGAP